MSRRIVIMFLLRLVFSDRQKETFPSLHSCFDAGEAYSAAFLISKEHLLQTPTDHLNLTWYLIAILPIHAY
jgi:hypothetical protein